MKTILAIAALLSSVFAVPAFAGDTGFYSALDLQTWNLTNLNGGSNPSTGFRIGGGYHFTQNWGAEVNYAESGSGTFGGQNYKANALQVAAIDTWHINDMFSLNARMGLTENTLTGDATTGCSCSKTGVILGTGGQYNINKQIGIRLEWDYLGNMTNSGAGGKLNANGITNISLGVVYDF